MNLGNNGSTFADGGRNTLCRAGSHVADGENAGSAGLEQKRAALHRRRREVATGHHKPLVICFDAALEPNRIRIGADEKEEVS